MKTEISLINVFEGELKFENAVIKVRELGEKSYIIERIFVPHEFRCMGYAFNALKEIVDAAKTHNIKLCANIFPDDQDDSTYATLRKMFTALGFVPLVMDGETYRNDVSFDPLQ